MSRPNTPLGLTLKIITRSQVKQYNQLSKSVDQMQIDSLKVKGSSKIKKIKI